MDMPNSNAAAQRAPPAVCCIRTEKIATLGNDSYRDTASGLASQGQNTPSMRLNPRIRAAQALLNAPASPNSLTENLTTSLLPGVVGQMASQHQLKRIVPSFNV
jgi:hypothetical protein